MSKRTAAEADIVTASAAKTVIEGLPSAVFEQLLVTRAKEPQLEILSLYEDGDYERFLVPAKSLDPALLVYMMGLPRQPSTATYPAEYYDSEEEGSPEHQQARALCTLMGAYIRSLPDNEQQDLTADFSKLKRGPLPAGYTVRTNTDLYQFCVHDTPVPPSAHNILATVVLSNWQ